MAYGARRLKIPERRGKRSNGPTSPKSGKTNWWRRRSEVGERFGQIGVTGDGGEGPGPAGGGYGGGGGERRSWGRMGKKKPFPVPLTL